MVNGIKELASYIFGTFGNSDDLAARYIERDGCICAIFYIKNICNRQYVAERVVAPMVRSCGRDFRGEFDGLLQSASLELCGNESDCLTSLSNGNAVVAVQTDRLYCASVAADAFSHRSVAPPDSDVTVKGPKAGFTESGEGNVAALRRIIKSPSLRVREFSVGRLTLTKVFVVYIDGRADGNVVQSVCRTLEGATSVCITDSGNIEQLLAPGGSFFPTVGSSEKVDKVASKLLSGRVGVVCDGSPFVLTVPYVFAESIQSAEDYIKPAWYATFMRFLRFFALLGAVLLPALFAAAVYHDSWILPPMLLRSLFEMEKDIKLPFIAEMLLMLTAFEIIREVGVRMPRGVGEAVSLVASLLIGDATVEAGIAGTAVLLIVAFSETSGYIVPAMNTATVLLRYIYLLAAYFAGFTGVFFAFGVTVIGLLKKKSFGAGYMLPIYPFSLSGMEDFLIAIPKKTLGRRERLR